MSIRNFDVKAGDLGSQSTPIVYGRQATANGIYHRLRMFFGEFFLDVSDGTPWFQSVLGKQAQDTAEFALKQRIATAPGVISITRFSFDLDRNQRRITVDCTVLDINNELIDVNFDEVII